MRTPSTRVVALGGIVAISTTAIVVRAADASPTAVTFFRMVYAIPVLLLLYAFVFRRDNRPAKARAIAVLSGIFLAADLTAWHVAIGEIGAGLGTVLVNTQVIFVAIAGWLIFRERPTRTALVLIPVILVGVLLLSGLGGSDAYGDNPWAGIAFGLLAGVFYAMFIFTLGASNRGYLAPAVGPLLDSTVGAAFSGLAIGLLIGLDFSFEITWPEHGWIMVMALVTQVFGWLLITYALPRLPALETSALILLQPMLAIIWARLLFDETLSWVQWLGVALVLGGLLILNARGAVEPKPRRLPAEAAS
jgi:drug/metabolite transporter (DMT)-like permease